MANEKYTPAEKIVLHLQAFRAGDAVDIGGRKGIGKRTIDLAISGMVESGKVLRVAHGLYVNADFAHNNGDLALALVANSYQSGMSISLGSALHDIKDNNRGVMQTVVPSGRIGALDTSIGKIEIHQVSQRLVSKIIQEFGHDSCFSSSPLEPLRVHSPEMAATLSAYLVMCGDRANFNTASLVSNCRVNWDTVQAMTAIARIPERFLGPVYESISAGSKAAKTQLESSHAQPSI